MPPASKERMQGGPAGPRDTRVISDVVQYDGDPEHFLQIALLRELHDGLLLLHDGIQIIVREGILVELLLVVVNLHFLGLELLQSVPLSLRWVRVSINWETY